MKIGTRQYVGFAAAFLLLALSMTILVYRQSVTFDETKRLTDPTIEKLNLASRIKEGNLENVINFISLLSERDKTRQQTLQAEIKK